MVSLFIFGKKDEVVPASVGLIDFFIPPPGRYIHLTADDRFDPVFPAGHHKQWNTKHIPVVGDGQSLHSRFSRLLYQLVDLAGPVEDRKLRMYV